jgi:hypothetical protein
VIGLATDFVSLAINSLAYEQSLYPPEASEEEIQEYYDRVHDYFGSLPAERFPLLVGMSDAMVEPGAEERLEFALDVLVEGVAALAESAKRRR